METLSYAITLTYSFRNEFPFSTYGENLFLTLQNVLITLLIIGYAPRSANKNTNIATALVAASSSFFVLSVIPESALALLQMSTLPLSLFSKLPQIRQNYRSQSTGQLSVFAVVSQIAGCLARLFTTATELGDSLVSAGFALALALNLVLGAQLWMYWGQEDHVKDEFGLRNGHGLEKPQERYVPSSYEPVPASWQQTRTATPPLQSSAGGNRKWARKVD